MYALSTEQPVCHCTATLLVVTHNQVRATCVPQGSDLNSSGEHPPEKAHRTLSRDTQGSLQLMRHTRGQVVTPKRDLQQAAWRATLQQGIICQLLLRLAGHQSLHNACCCGHVCHDAVMMFFQFCCNSVSKQHGRL